MKALVVRPFALVLWLASLTAFAVEPSADALGEHQITRSTSGFAAERKTEGPRDPATLEESKLAPHEVVRQTKHSTAVPPVFFGDAWIYEVSIELFDDFDGDGYYSYLRVRFDADTIFNRHYVYAALLLSADGVVWEELYITEDFLIRGTSPHDDYEIEVELVAGYPSGFYDVLIELYDSELGLLLDEFGPAQSSAMSLLPLEDAHRDGGLPPVSKGRGGAGATSWMLLILLGGAVLARRRYHRT